MMRLALESARVGEHVHVTVRMGETPGPAALCGTLIMRHGEWQILGATIGCGAEFAAGQLCVEFIEGTRETAQNGWIGELREVRFELNRAMERLAALERQANE